MASRRSTTWAAVGLASGSLAVHCLYSAATAAGQSRGTRRSGRPFTVGCLPAQPEVKACSTLWGGSGQVGGHSERYGCTQKCGTGRTKARKNSSTTLRSPVHNSQMSTPSE